MIATVLLLIALLAALGAMPVRARLAGDPAYSDGAVRRFDLVAAAILAGLFTVAAVVASASAPISGADLASTQVIAVLAAGATGGPVVRVVLTTGGIPTRNENFDDPEHEPPLVGGRVIGVLERTAVAVCLLVGWPAGIAVILGVKGLARFPQLREHRASEQFIIGTFTSVLWACAAAGIAYLAGA